MSSDQSNRAGNRQVMHPGVRSAVRAILVLLPAAILGIHTYSLMRENFMPEPFYLGAGWWPFWTTVAALIAFGYLACTSRRHPKAASVWRGAAICAATLSLVALYDGTSWNMPAEESSDPTGTNREPAHPGRDASYDGPFYLDDNGNPAPSDCSGWAASSDNLLGYRDGWDLCEGWER